MKAETNAIRDQLVRNIKNDVLMKKDVNMSHLNVYPDINFSKNKILKVEIFLDLNKLYRKHSERPYLFENLSLEYKRDLLSFDDFTISLYKQKVRSNPAAYRSQVSEIPDSRSLVTRRRITNFYELYRVFGKGTAIAAFAFDDVLDSTSPGTQIMYSYEVDFGDRMPVTVMRLKQDIKLMIRQVSKGMNLLNAPASGFLKDPIKGRDTGLLNPYTGKYRLPKHYGGPVNSHGFYSSDFVNSTKARLLNVNIHALLSLYVDAMEFVYGEKGFAYSTLLKDKSVNKVERNLGILKTRIFETMSDTYKVKLTTRPKYLRLLLDECTSLVNKMDKMCNEKRLTDGTTKNGSAGRRIKFSKKFSRSIATIEGEKMYLPIIYTRLHHQQDLDRKYETLKTLREHRSADTGVAENLDFSRPIADLPSPIFGMKRCYDIKTGNSDAQLHLDNLKKIHNEQHGHLGGSTDLRQGMSSSAVVNQGEGGY